MSWAVRVYGTPVAQGSMKCVGGRGRHQLVDNKNAALKPWRAAVAAAGQRLVDHHQLAILTCPLQMDVVFTVGLPRTVKPEDRPWPSLKAARTADGGGDLDKMVRAVGDALTGVLFRDDSQVCVSTVAKVYPHTPHPEALDRPGAFIHVSRL